MYAFAAPSFFGARVGATNGAVRVSAKPVCATTKMAIADPSPSMPFLPKPKNLSEDMIGYTGFDPFKLCEVFDTKWMQQSEIKHGRICMLAFVGILAQEFVHLPGAVFSNPLATEALKQVPKGGLFQIFLFCGLVEYITHKGKMTYTDMFSDPETEPGVFGFNPLNLKMSDANRLKEIKNGRLAMCGVGGVIHSMFIYKTPVIAQLLDFQPMQF